MVGAAKTGQIGDGKILVVDLESAVRIRTGENRRCGDLNRTLTV
jgi:nitrogen regulatory protein PII